LLGFHAIARRQAVTQNRDPDGRALCMGCETEQQDKQQ